MAVPKRKTSKARRENKSFDMTPPYFCCSFVTLPLTIKQNKGVSKPVTPIICGVFAKWL